MSQLRKVYLDTENNKLVVRGSFTGSANSAEIVDNSSQQVTPIDLDDDLSGDPTSFEPGDVTLTTGSIIIGTAGVGAALDAKGDGKIIIGNGTTAASQTVSGDITITNAGVTAIGNNKVTAAKLVAGMIYGVAIEDAKTTSREENVAGLSSAITLCNEIREDIINHFANATRHTTGQQSTGTLNAACTDLSTLLALSGQLLTHFAAHNTDAIQAGGWSYHTAQTADKVLTSAVTPVTLQEAVTRLNDLKTKYNDHEDEAVGHAVVGSVVADQVGAAAAAYGTAILATVTGAATGDLVQWSILNDGTGNVTGVSAVAGTNTVTFTFSADPQNDTIISYGVFRAAV